MFRIVICVANITTAAPLERVEDPRLRCVCVHVLYGHLVHGDGQRSGFAHVTMVKTFLHIHNQTSASVHSHAHTNQAKQIVLRNNNVVMLRKTAGDFMDCKRYMERAGGTTHRQSERDRGREWAVGRRLCGLTFLLLGAMETYRAAAHQRKGRNKDKKVGSQRREEGN